MVPFLMYLAKVSISISAVYLLYALMLRKLTFYRWNRWYLLVYPALCFLLPLMDIGPLLEARQEDPEILGYLPSMGSWNSPAAEPAGRGIGWVEGGFLVIVAGFAVMLIRALVLYFSLLQIRRRAALMADGPVKLYAVQEPIIPFSFGSAVYVNPVQHTEDDLSEIIQHEMVHVRQYHTIDILFSEFLVVINWFNPFVWLIRKAIRQNLEFIADRQVLEYGLDRRRYQYLLLKVVGQQPFGLGSHLNFSSLKTRITMMNKIRSARVHLVRFSFALPLAAVLLLAFRKQEKNLPVQVAEEVRPPAVQAPVDTVAPGKTKALPADTAIRQFVLVKERKNGNATVMIKDSQGRVIRSMSEADWDKNKAEHAKRLGLGTPPPPPPPAPAATVTPPAPPAPPEPDGKITANIPEGVIYMVNGKEWSAAEVNGIDPQKIRSVNILKNESAVRKYGEKAQKGVIELELRESE